MIFKVPQYINLRINAKNLEWPRLSLSETISVEVRNYSCHGNGVFKCPELCWKCVWQGFALLNKFYNLHKHLEVGGPQSVKLVC